MNLYYYQTTIGKIALAEEGGKLTHFLFPRKAVPKGAELKETAVLKEAARQLEAYLAGRLNKFDLPLAPEGTEFQKKVWKALLRVPYGKTASYKDIAAAIGNPKAVRAVGMANNRNPLAVFIPCHRIIGADGKLVGYGGGLGIKERLLELEADGSKPAKNR